MGENIGLGGGGNAGSKFGADASAIVRTCDALLAFGDVSTSEVRIPVKGDRAEVVIKPVEVRTNIARLLNKAAVNQLDNTEIEELLRALKSANDLFRFGVTPDSSGDVPIPSASPVGGALPVIDAQGFPVDAAAMKLSNKRDSNKLRIMEIAYHLTVISHEIIKAKKSNLDDVGTLEADIKKRRKESAREMLELRYPGCSFDVLLEEEAEKKSTSCIDRRQPLPQFPVFTVDPSTNERRLIFLRWDPSSRKFIPSPLSKPLSRGDIREFVLKNHKPAAANPVSLIG
ncbi:MAG: hypothetical protein LBH53_02980 [Puniceicoccales bacterium]|nr:hypothetical protein [Puniceicoccales bacterium]